MNTHKRRSFSLLLGLLLSALPAAAISKDQQWNYVRVVAVAKDQLSMDVEVAPFLGCGTTVVNDVKCQQLHLLIQDSVVKDRLKSVGVSDRVNVTFYTGDQNQNVLRAFCKYVAPEPEPHTRFWSLVLTAAACFLVACLWSRFRPQQFLLGEDNRYSNSKFQIALWFFVLITTYATTFLLRAWYAGCEFIGGINIPTNLLLLTGMSALTFAGAKGITTSKVARATTAANPQPKPRADTPSLWNLVQNDDGLFDFGDFQMLVVTIVAVITYLVLVFSFLSTIEASKTISLPDLDTTILAAFGLGQGSYLAKKAAGQVRES